MKGTLCSKAQPCLRNANSSFIQGRFQRAPARHVLSSAPVRQGFICSRALTYSDRCSRIYGDSFYFRGQMKILGGNQNEHNHDSRFMLFKNNGTLDDQRNPTFLVMTMGSPGQDCAGPGPPNAGAPLPSSTACQTAARMSVGEMLPLAVKQIRHSLFPLPYPASYPVPPIFQMGFWVFG